MWRRIVDWWRQPVRPGPIRPTVCLSRAGAHWFFRSPRAAYDWALPHRLHGESFRVYRTGPRRVSKAVVVGDWEYEDTWPALESEEFVPPAEIVRLGDEVVGSVRFRNGYWQAYRGDLALQPAPPRSYRHGSDYRRDAAVSEVLADHYRSRQMS